MKEKLVVCLFWAMCVVVGNSEAQERGKFRKNPKIKQNTTNTYNPNFPVVEPQREAESEFKVETSTLNFQSQFEPVKPLNPVVSEDTSSLDEGEPEVLEVVDSMQIGDEWVKIADYFVIWDSRSINPYNMNPREFEETIDLKLYDPAENRFWNTPVEGPRVTSNFGYRWGRWHTGTDIDLETGDPVYSTFDGMVRIVGWDGSGYGRYVMVRHYNGLETLYGHMSKPLVESGQIVRAGDILGLGGSTGRSSGSHLHYENRYEGNPFDTKYIFDWENQQIRSDHFVLTSQVWDYLRGGKAAKNEFEEANKPAYSRTMLHRVRSGETLSSIASRYGLSASALAKRNRLSLRSTLRIGQKLIIK
ncbi:M23 family metallopeptidase [Arundinibacter roseus]|uniref:LysM peptidoglycan-binding domain-containing protein n=1 Tax=Arundinibacter roseus TaxID=2070510 RepID=A0A4R4KGS2_9BACT|nr:M23 family metallopeptidase [Arundinibacter roseus]TDB66943.1 LysM peptidoglycan-binding domain-containing protein [Arundinibacter roseus]